MSTELLGPYSHEPHKTKRAISVLDRDFDLMGLSRNNAVHDDDSFFIEDPSIEHLKNMKDDLNSEEEGLRLPFQAALDAGYNDHHDDMDPLLADIEAGGARPFHDLPDTAGLAFRHRSQTFNFPASQLPLELLIQDPKQRVIS